MYLYIGALVGYHNGTLRSSCSTGSVSQTGTGTGAFVGGLTGCLTTDSTIAASWSGAHVSAAAASGEAGGITGRFVGGTARAAYSTGAVSAAGANAYAGDMAGGHCTPFGDSNEISGFYAMGPITANRRRRRDIRIHANLGERPEQLPARLRRPKRNRAGGGDGSLHPHVR